MLPLVARKGFLWVWCTGRESVISTTAVLATLLNTSAGPFLGLCGLGGRVPDAVGNTHAPPGLLRGALLWPCVPGGPCVLGVSAHCRGAGRCSGVTLGTRDTVGSQEPWTEAVAVPTLPWPEVAVGESRGARAGRQGARPCDGRVVVAYGPSGCPGVLGETAAWGAVWPQWISARGSLSPSATASAAQASPPETHLLMPSHSRSGFDMNLGENRI